MALFPFSFFCFLFRMAFFFFISEVPAHIEEISHLSVICIENIFPSLSFIIYTL